MRYIVFILPLLLLQQLKSQDSNTIYLEYKETFYKSFKYAIQVSSDLKQFWKIGDTIKLRDDSYLIFKWDSTGVYMNFMVDIARGSKLKIIDYNEDWVELEELKQNGITGLMNRRDFELTYSGMEAYEKWDFATSFLKYQELLKDSLKSKYNLTDSSLNEIIYHFEGKPIEDSLSILY